MDQIKNILISRGYTEKQALAVIPELLKMDDSLHQGLQCWLGNEEEMDYQRW